MRVIKNIPAIAACLCLGLFSGCASLASEKEYEVDFRSSPKNATIEIVNKKRRVLFKGTTPVKVFLPAGRGYFSKADYQIRFSKEGYENQHVPLKASLDAWYFGNSLFGFGSFIGFLFVDPATGAMFKIDQGVVSVALNKVDSDTEELP